MVWVKLPFWTLISLNGGCNPLYTRALVVVAIEIFDFCSVGERNVHIDERWIPVREVVNLLFIRNFFKYFWMLNLATEQSI